MAFQVNSGQLAEVAQRIAELFTEIYTGLEDRPVSTNPDREELMGRFAHTLGEEGTGLEQLPVELAEWVIPHAMGIPNPLYLGLVNSSPLPAAALTDLIVSALNNNGGGFEQAPPMYAAEEEVVRAFSELFGYNPEESDGLLVPGGSFAILHGLLLARTQHFPDWTRLGPSTLEGKPTLYVSEPGHFAVERSARAMGIGSEGVVKIPAKGRGHIDMDELARRVDSDRHSGRLPFCVVATAGTTGTGAIDPLSQIADFCQSERMWMHVDACYGGAGILDPQVRELYAGIERADSISVDPHKWFFIPMVAGLALTRHPEVELEAFDVTPSYIPQHGPIDRFRRGVPASRRGAGLTVWAGVRAHGWATIREAVTRNIQTSRRFESNLVGHGFNVLEGGRLSVVCARWEPDDFDAAATDELQREIAAAVTETGKAWFATVTHEGKTWLRFNFVNLYVQPHHVDELAKLIAEVAHRLSGD